MLMRFKHDPSVIVQVLGKGETNATFKGIVVATKNLNFPLHEVCDHWDRDKFVPREENKLVNRELIDATRINLKGGQFIEVSTGPMGLVVMFSENCPTASLLFENAEYNGKHIEVQTNLIIAHELEARKHEPERT